MKSKYSNMKSLLEIITLDWHAEGHAGEPTPAFVEEFERRGKPFGAELQQLVAEYGDH